MLLGLVVIATFISYWLGLASYFLWGSSLLVSVLLFFVSGPVVAAFFCRLLILPKSSRPPVKPLLLTHQTALD